MKFCFVPVLPDRKDIWSTTKPKRGEVVLPLFTRVDNSRLEKPDTLPC